MYIIKKFENFLYKINELDATGTYLDPVKFKREPISKSNQDTTITRKRFGKLFAQAPKTADKSWGLQFVENGTKYGGTMYKVIFSDEFMKKFDPTLPKPYTKPTTKYEEPISSFKRTAELKFSRNPRIAGFGVEPKQVSSEIGVIKPGEKINWKELNDVNIVAVRGSGFNRTHFLPGVPNQFKGIGLGYVVYEEFIKFLGYASSNQSASKEAQKVWSQIIQDPDFYAIVAKEDINNGSVFVVHKDCNLPGVDDIIEKWIDNLKFYDSYRGVIVDENIYKKYPKLDAYKEAWKPETIIKLKNIVQLITDSLISGNNTKFDEIVKFAADNRFKATEEQEKLLVKTIIEDLESNSNKFDLYKKGFEKLLSLDIISFDSLNSVSIEKGLRLKLTEYLFEKLGNKKGVRKLGKLLENSELKKKILSIDIDKIEDPYERFEYYQAHTDKKEDYEKFIEWINNFQFGNAEHRDDYAMLILFIYVSDNKEDIIKRIDKNIINIVFEILDENLCRNNSLLFVDNLEEIKTADYNRFKFINDQLTISNSIKFYDFIIDYIKDKDKKEMIQEFLDKHSKNQ